MSINIKISEYHNKLKHKATHCQYKKRITLQTSRATMDLYAGISNVTIKVPTIKKEGVQLKLNF